MKTNRLLAGLSAGLLVLSGAQAQSQTCDAAVSKRTITPSEKRESTWDIVFDVKAPGCDNSRGQFDYFLDVSAAGRRETVKGTTEFNTENGQPTAVMVSHQARPGEDVLGVSGASIKTCVCVK